MEPEAKYCCIHEKPESAITDSETLCGRCVDMEEAGIVFLDSPLRKYGGEIRIHSGCGICHCTVK
jgi:hypothetical protein